MSKMQAVGILVPEQWVLPGFGGPPAGRSYISAVEKGGQGCLPEEESCGCYGVQNQVLPGFVRSGDFHSLL